MNFTFHQLRIFVEVTKKKNITKAAEAMFMTQPALSIQLKNFQMQFDIPLTETIGKKIFITDFGYSIAAIAEGILQEADSLQYKTTEFKGLLAGKLRISSASTGKYVIPYFLTDFMQQYPDVDLMLDVSNKQEVIRHLTENEVDFALVSTLPKKLEVEEEILMENKLYMVSNQKEIKPDLPLIFRESGSATGMAMQEYFSARKFSKKIQLTSNEAVKQAIVSGLGYSILPLIGIKNELLNEQLYIIESKGLPIVTSWRLIWLKGKKLSPLSQAYLDYVRANKYTLIEKHFNWFTRY